MKNLKLCCCYAIAVLTTMLLSNNLIGQTTSSYDQVYNILQTKCDGSSCHRPESSSPLKLTDSTKAFIYANLINTLPINPFARDSMGNKIIDPGNPGTSFLLRKVLCDRGPEPDLEVQEGNCMPSTPQSNPVGLLDSNDVDLIRIWIAGGAPETGTVTGIFDIDNEAPVAKVFPNPFNNSFDVSFNQSKSNRVKLELYDLLGKRIALLMDEQLIAGNHEFKFNSPAPTAPGVYFLSVAIGNSISSTKVVKMN